MATVAAPKFHGKNGGIQKTKQFNASFLNRSRVMKFLNELFFSDEELGANTNHKVKKDLDQL